MTTLATWSSLPSGERVRIQSASGREYSGVHLASTSSGVFMRMKGRGLVRLDRNRVNLRTLVCEGKTSPLCVDDEVLVVRTDGQTDRGHVVEAASDRLTYEPLERSVVSAPLRDVRSVHLCFRAGTLRSGDEFLALSNSGREYRGTVLEASAKTIQIRSSAGDEIALRVTALDLRSLVVLIPVAL